jgi:hypothetical protein
MNKVVYLIGAGATCGELSFSGIEADTSMTGISENVYNMSKSAKGSYWKLVDGLGLQLQEQDIELIMSLFESYLDSKNGKLNQINAEMRKLFRRYLISQITDQIKVPQLLTSLIHLHGKYEKFIGENGEKVLGFLTINYDSLLEDAFYRLYGRLNLGGSFESKEYEFSDKVIPVLKLHGSFNWQIEEEKILVSNDIGQKEDNNGWIPPSVYKKPSGNIVFQSIWKEAKDLLTDCDILRVVGSSLRNEDWSLISLLFTSQIESERIFEIELIVPNECAVGTDREKGIIERLGFLGKMKPSSLLPIFSEQRDEENIFRSWLNNTATWISEKEPSIFEDETIIENLRWR